NHVGKTGAAMPAGNWPGLPSVTGGVRSDRCFVSARRCWLLSNCSSRIVRRGSGIVVNELARMSHSSNPPTTTERVGRSTIAPGPKVDTTWLSRCAFLVMRGHPHWRSPDLLGRAAEPERLVRHRASSGLPRTADEERSSWEFPARAACEAVDADSACLHTRI